MCKSFLLCLIFQPEVIGEELRHLVGGEGGDIDDEIVVAGVVAGFPGEGLRVILTGLVNVINQFARLLFIDFVLFHNALHTMLHIGDEEDFDSVGGVLENMEARTTDHDAGLMLGKIAQGLGFCIVELLGSHLTGLLSVSSSNTELLVETAEL